MLCSLDGFVAKNDGTVEWMYSDSKYSEGDDLTEEEIKDFLQSVDCYVMGSKTYEHALELGWPYGEKPVFVFNKRELQSDRESVLFLNGEVSHELANTIKPRYKNIWMVGGPQLASEFFKQGLVNELVITIVPIILGSGLPFFQEISKDIQLLMKKTRAFKDGMVETTYQVK